MAITRAETQVTWPTAANSATVTAGSNQTSETVTLDATCIAAQISVKGDNSTTPAADDQIDVWLLQTSGDPDGTGADEDDTPDHAYFLGTLDTNQDDPAQFTIELPIPQKSFKIFADGARAGTTNSITVSATVTEQRFA